MAMCGAVRPETEGLQSGPSVSNWLQFGDNEAVNGDWVVTHLG
jgi:hypothetical protein